MLRRLVSTFGSLAVCALGLSAFSLPAASQATLTFTGQVYSPLGPAVSGSSAAHGDPIPNILVYVADPASPIPTFSQGVTVPTGGETGCAAQPSLVPTTVLGSNLTDYTGTFTFNVSSSLPDPMTVVIQAGKWRRKYQYTAAEIASYTSGTTVTLPTMSMPANQSQGDLPHIAVVTGSADEIECIFPQIGISTSEVTDPSGSGSINFFSGNGSSGEIVSTSTPTETQLVNPNASKAVPITNYDMVIFGCQGPAGETDSDASTYDESVVNYANDGGRVFGTHWEFSWIKNPPEWSPLASWSTSTSTASVTTTGQLSPDYTGEPTLASWMNYIGSFNINPSQYEFTLTAVFYENLLAVNPPAETWVTLPNYSGNSNQFSFDTPVGATGRPSAVLNFTNSQTKFALGDTNDSVIINVTDNSATATQTGLTLTLQIPSGISPTSLQDSNGGYWQCTLATPTATCTLPAQLAPGASDAVTLAFSIPQTTTPGTATITGTLTGGGIDASNQCGRVLYNDYHVENAGSKVAFNNGARCTSTGTLTAAQKFLEYSLYNLSNFIAPTTSDVIVIQAPSQTTITTTLNGVTSPGVETPIYYGQIIGDTDGVNANVTTTAPSGPNNGSLTVSVDGTLVCTLPNTGNGICPNGGFEGQNAGAHTVQAAFTGDTIYQPSQSPLYDVQILSDSTTTAVTSSSSAITIGSAVTLTATVNAPYASPAGPVAFYDGTTLLGSSTLNSATSTTATATFNTTTLGVGPHTITAVYAADPVGANPPNFLGSSSTAISVVVALPPSNTSTTLASTPNPSYVGQNVTLTATVAQLPFTIVVPVGDVNPAPTGTVSFYDGTNLLGTGTVNASGVANFSTTSLTLGTHSLTAVYAGDTYNLTSTSSAVSQVVTPSTFTMAIAPTSISMGAGMTTSVTLTITDIGGFNEPVSLTCAGPASSETACDFAQLIVPAGGGTTKVLFSPSAPHPCGETVVSSNRGPRSMLPVLAGLGFAIFLARKRKKLVRGLTLALALCVLPMLNGCGTSGCTDFGVLPGTYTFTVTGTSLAPLAITQTQTVTITVKP